SLLAVPEAGAQRRLPAAAGGGGADADLAAGMPVRAGHCPGPGLHRQCRPCGWAADRLRHRCAGGMAGAAALSEPPCRARRTGTSGGQRNALTTLRAWIAPALVGRSAFFPATA